MLLESFNEFVMEKSLSKYSEPTSELQLEYPNAKIIDISSSKVKYNKSKKRFEIKERDFKDFGNYEKIILHNSKTNKGVMAKKGGKIQGEGEYVGEYFWAGLGESGVPYDLKHELWIYYTKPQKMTHAEKMSSGFYGPLD